MSRRTDPPPRTSRRKEEDTTTAISFNIVGPVAEMFEKVRTKARSNPEFWSHSRLTKADFARHLLMKSLVDMAKDLGMRLEGADD